MLVYTCNSCWFVFFQFAYSLSICKDVILSFSQPIDLSRVGIYLHGENNQNPKCILSFSTFIDSFLSYLYSDLIIQTSIDNKTFTTVAESELEQRAGDHLFDLEKPVTARYIKFIVV